MTSLHDIELGQYRDHDGDRTSTKPLRQSRDDDGSAMSTGFKKVASADGSDLQHRDAFGRPLSRKERDEIEDNTETFLDPADGRLRVLRVQFSDQSQFGYNDLAPGWDCHKMIAASQPQLIKLVDYTYRSRASVTLMYVPAVFWMIACLFCLSTIEPEMENQGQYEPVLYRDWHRPGIARNPKEEREAQEDDHRQQSSVGKNVSNRQGRDYREQFIPRRPMPSFLCYVEDIDVSADTVQDDIARELGSETFDDYVFVSYTRMHFRTSPKYEVTDSPEDKRQKRLEAQRNRFALLKIGVTAAKQAGVPAFWLDCFPLVDVAEDKQEVYRMCDYVRAAHSVVVAIDTGSHVTVDSVYEKMQREALGVWGSRLWTLPELLLAPSGRKIMVFDRQREGQIGRSYNRQNLGSLAWRVKSVDTTVENDWAQTSQLLDHYDGTVHLSRLELIDIVHAALRRRATDLWHPGDVSYALMGLLRRRPAAVKGDSDFVAFARLSLSNDSDSILERLLCMQPPSAQTSWWRMVDAYGARLYDIEPLCQIAAIDKDFVDPKDRSQERKRASKTIVVLDGAYGASIEWSTLEPIPFFKRKTTIRRLTKTLLPIAPWVLLISALILGVLAWSSQQISQTSQQIQNAQQAAEYVSSPVPYTVTETTVSTTATSVFEVNVEDFYTEYYSGTVTITTTGTSYVPAPTPTITGGTSVQSTVESSMSLIDFYLAIDCLIVALSLAILCAGPALLRNLYRGKFWSTQARFYGIQGGPCSLQTLEHSLFGLDNGRLRWSTSTSLQSKPIRTHDDFYDGAQPPSDLPLRDSEGRFLFTLVDTYVLEATVFYASRPPSVVMICGKEGGMLRAVLCSYDCRTQTFCREVVLRMKTIVLNRMARVDKFRFALKRSPLINHTDD